MSSVLFGTGERVIPDESSDNVRKVGTPRQLKPILGVLFPENAPATIGRIGHLCHHKGWGETVRQTLCLITRLTDGDWRMEDVEQVVLRAQERALEPDNSGSLDIALCGVGREVHIGEWTPWQAITEK